MDSPRGRVVLLADEFIGADGERYVIRKVDPPLWCAVGSHWSDRKKSDCPIHGEKHGA